MAPSIIEVEEASSSSTRHISSAAPNTSSSTRELSTSTDLSNDDTHLAKTFKSDLTSIRGLITCTICAQLLYEPWTLACGHTYCYSCLCQWFQQHQFRKTCPDCRTQVDLMPAPSFTIKQMIEIFISRVELLPPDESVAQHRKNIDEERMAVEIDKTTEDGLFKGCFKASNLVHRQWVEEEGMYVCSGCLHEYIPGDRRCGHCNTLFEDYDPNDVDFDDMDSFDGDEGQELYDIEVDDMGIDLDDDSDDSDDQSFMDQLANRTVRSADIRNVMAMHGRREGHLLRHRIINLDSGDENDEDEDEEETESMRDFIASDSQRSTPVGIRRSSRAPSVNSHISLSSDDDSEDEGIIQRRRGDRNARRMPRVSSGESVSVESSDYDTDTSASRRSVITNQAGQEDSEVDYGYLENGGYSPLQGSDDGSEGSTSETIHEDDLRTRDSSSATPRHSIRTSSSPYGYGGYGIDHSDDEIDQYDRDGDVEMSLSPERSAASITSDSDRSDRTPGFSSEDLGPATVFAEDEDDDSEGSIRPPVRRRRQPRNIMSGATARGEDEDVTLTQLFTRPPTGRRTSPTFDSQRILEWHASMRSSPVQPYRHSSLQSRRADVLAASSARPPRIGFQSTGRIDRVHRGARGRYSTG